MMTMSSAAHPYPHSPHVSAQAHVLHIHVSYLEDDDGGRLDLLIRIESAIDVVVDGLHDCLALLELLHAAKHVVEVVFAGVECSQA